MTQRHPAVYARNLLSTKQSAEGGKMSQDIDEQLIDVQARLGETVSAFEVYKTLNEMADPSINAELNDKIQRHGQFWQATLVGQQTVFVVGIGALVDTRSDVASLDSVFKLLKPKLSTAEIADIDARLASVRAKYVKYRHKLFGHNAHDRRDVIADFNNEGFTIDVIEADLEELEFVFKFLFVKNAGQTPPTFANAKNFNFPYRIAALAAADDTKNLLMSLN